MKPCQRFRFRGGPLDGSTFRLDVDARIPEEIVFRHVGPPLVDHVYRLDVASLLDLRLSVCQAVRVYDLVGASEVAQIVEGYARRLIVCDCEIGRLKRANKRLGELVAKHRAGRRAAKRRRTAARSQSPPPPSAR